jgi:hypothetical protein
MSVCLMFSINLLCFFFFSSLSQATTPPTPKNPTQQVTCVSMVKASLLITQDTISFYRVRRDELKATPDSGLDITYTCYPTYWNTSCHAIPAKTVIRHGDSLRRMKQGLTESYIFEQFSKLLPSGYCV